MNPLQKILDQLEEAQESLKHLEDDLKFGLLGNIDKQKLKLMQLKSRLAFLTTRKELGEQLMKNVVNLHKLSDEELLTALPNLKAENYKFFNDTLKPWQRLYSNNLCDWCGKKNTTRSGIVFTVDPLTAEFTEICDYCFIERRKGNKGGISNSHWESLETL